MISTDPAHNLSDAFNQRFNKHATLVNGYKNLYAMEIDPTIEIENNDIFESISSSSSSSSSTTNNTASLLSEIASSIPGIDEAMSFSELMKQVTAMHYSCIVFDTAPTGHTLRLLSFPTILDKALTKLLSLRSKFSGLFNQMSHLLISQTGMNIDNNTVEDKILNKLTLAKETITLINNQFRDADMTTFICVCIPEFLSLYETERLVQELSIYEMDVCNIVVNQVNMMEQGSQCRKCKARNKMQQKYIDQIYTLYEDFHIILLPLLETEVRGVPMIQRFARYLLHPEEARAEAERPISNNDNSCNSSSSSSSVVKMEHEENKR